MSESPSSPPTMSEQRSLMVDLAAVCLAAVAGFAWLALLSHDPADPLDTALPLLSAVYEPYPAGQLAFPMNSSVTNRCGLAGAYVSSLLLHSFGAAAYLVAALAVLAVVVIVRQRPIASPLGRSLGWTLTLFAIMTLAEVLRLRPSIPAPLGPGGSLGALSAYWMQQHFAHTGAILLCLGFLVAGLMLSTEYLLFRGLSAVSLALWLTGVRLGTPVARAVKQTAIAGTEKFKRDRVASRTIAAGASLTTALDPSAADVVAAPPEKPPFAGEGPTIRIGGQSKVLTPVTDKAKEPVAASGESPAEQPAEFESDTSDTTKPRSRSITAAIGAIAKKVRKDVDVDASETSPIDPPPSVPQAVSAGATADPESTATPAEQMSPQKRIDSSHGAMPPIRARTKPQKEAAAEDLLADLDDTHVAIDGHDYQLPPIELLTPSEEFSYEEQMVEIRRKAAVLEQTFQSFGFDVRVVEIETGPVIAQYEIELEAGLRLSKITSLADDIAIALRVPSVRIVAPIPGKNTVGIEVPNETRQIVRLRDVIEETGDAIRKMKIPLYLGKDVSGKPLAVDLASMPHLLIAGRTGTGKSVCLNTIITSMLMTKKPDEVRLLMIDPKMVELSGYGRLPHLMHPVVTDMQKAEAILAWAVDKMEERYSLLARAGVRHLVSYNQLDRKELLDRIKPQSEQEEAAIPEQLPFIVIVADEMADLMMTAGKEVEQHIIRLAQKSRAVGIHLILATQKPTVDVITGLIKSNLPARISFQVASRTDSRVVLDEMGADKLLGNGDMLFLWPGTSTLVRGQGTYLSDEEINAVVNHCAQGEQNFVPELLHIKSKAEEPDAEDEAVNPARGYRKRDELYEAAVDVVVREGRGSCSLLQRALGIGYGRAASLIDHMAEDGIVGEYNGSKARDVTISIAQWEAMQKGGPAAESNAWSDSPADALAAHVDDDY